MGRFSGKTAIVTGGRRGIGKAFSLALREEGAAVVAIGKSPDRGFLPANIAYVMADLSSREERAGLIERLGGCDILINNAGIAHPYAALDYPLDEWYKILEINLTAVFDLSCQAVRMGCKRIINIASISGHNGARKIAGYAATKHAIIGLTKCLSNEWADRGVTVNSISPGFIQTDMLKLDATNIGRIPVGRVGLPEEVVPLILLLASDEGAYMTGADYLVDGGWIGR